MKFTYRQLRDNNFAVGMAKLAQHSFKSPKFGFNVAKIHDAIATESKTAADLFGKLVDQYALKDADGKIVPLPNTRDTYQIPDERQGAWKPVIEEFLSVEFAVQRPPLQAADLEKEAVGLTPLEISALGEALTGFE